MIGTLSDVKKIIANGTNESSVSVEKHLLIPTRFLPNFLLAYSMPSLGDEPEPEPSAPNLRIRAQSRGPGGMPTAAVGRVLAAARTQGEQSSRCPQRGVDSLIVISTPLRGTLPTDRGLEFAHEG